MNSSFGWSLVAAFFIWLAVYLWLLDPLVRWGIGRVFQVNIGRRRFKPNWIYTERLTIRKALVLQVVEIGVQFVVIGLPFIVLIWIQNR